MAAAEGFVRRLTRRLTGTSERRDVEELNDEAALTGAASDRLPAWPGSHHGRHLRSVEMNAWGCAGGVRAELFDGTDTVMLVWLASGASPASSRAHPAGARPPGTLENGARPSTTRITRSSVDPPPRGRSRPRRETRSEDKPTPAQALMAQMGGVRGLIYSALPVAVLVPVNTPSDWCRPSAPRWAAAALDPGLAAVRHDSIQPAVSGFIGSG